MTRAQRHPSDAHIHPPVRVRLHHQEHTMGSVVRHLLQRRYRSNGTRAPRHPRLEPFHRRRGYYGPPRAPFVPHFSTFSPSDFTQAPSSPLPDRLCSRSRAFPLLPSTSTEQRHCARQHDPRADLLGCPPWFLFVPPSPLQASPGIVTIFASIINAVYPARDIGGRTCTQATAARC